MYSIINQVTSSKRSIASLLNDEKSVDYSRLIEPPRYFSGQNGYNMEYLEAAQAYQNNNLELFEGFSSEIREKSLQYVRAYRVTGYFTLVHWRMDNWGDSYNAFDTVYLNLNPNLINKGQKVNNCSVIFESSNPPHPVIQRLAFDNRDEEIVHSWAAEDAGENSGYCVYRKGKLQEKVLWLNGCHKAFELRFELCPQDRHNYQLVDGEYIQIEE